MKTVARRTRSTLDGHPEVKERRATLVFPTLNVQKATGVLLVTLFSCKPDDIMN